MPMNKQGFNFKSLLSNDMANLGLLDILGVMVAADQFNGDDDSKRTGAFVLNLAKGLSNEIDDLRQRLKKIEQQNNEILEALGKDK